MDLEPLLHQYSTYQSFEKGVNYYHKGLVTKLIKNGNEYEAEVRGTDMYKQYIKLESEDELIATCSCPYSQGGICKHLVAVGLAIQNEEFTEVLLSKEPSKESIDEAHFFSEIYDSADKDTKLKFLEQLLRTQAHLRNQYAQYIAPVESQLATVDIEAIQKKMAKRIQSEGFSEDDLWEAAGEGSYYEDALDSVLSEKVEAVFEPFDQQLESLLNQASFEDALRLLLGMYEGVYLFVKKPDFGEGAFFDFADLAWIAFENAQNEILSDLHESVIQTALLKRMQDIWFGRWDHYERTYDINKPHKSVRYEWERFTDLLLGLAKDEVSLHYLDMRLQTYQLFDQASAAPLLLSVARLKSDTALWIRISERFAAEDLAIADELLKHYQLAGKRQEFIGLARRIYEVHEALGESLIENLDVSDDPELYKKILGTEMRKRHSIDLYHQWKTLASEEERNVFIDSQQTVDFVSQFYILLLEAEERYEDIHSLAQKYYVQRDSLTYMLRPIVAVHPEFCFHLLADTVAQSVEVDRGRSAYKTICEWLQLMKEIPGYEAQAEMVIQECYKQRLPSLKDEMRRAGLI